MRKRCRIIPDFGRDFRQIHVYFFQTISHILHEETASFTCNVSSFAVAAEVMVETEDSDLVVTSMNETECGLMDLDARQHADDHTTL